MIISQNLYDRSPYYWTVVGAALIFVGTYLGVTQHALWYAFGIGGGSFACAWALRIFRLRLARKNTQPRTPYDYYLDQTCELNLGAAEEK